MSRDWSEEKTMFDMKNLSRLKKLDENAPQPMKAFWAFDKAAVADGVLLDVLPVHHEAL